MKNWNIPTVEELEVKLTASSGVPALVEADGYLENGWNDATYDRTMYEKLDENDTCTVLIENSASVES